MPLLILSWPPGILAALVVSIGIVASVPVTTWLASGVVGEGGAPGRRRRGAVPSRRASPRAPTPDDTESEFWDRASREQPEVSWSPPTGSGEHDRGR